MPAAEPLTAPTAPAPIANAFTRIAQLRAAGFDLVYPERGELARLIRGREIMIIRATHAALNVALEVST
jgi:hypothetical protein